MNENQVFRQRGDALAQSGQHEMSECIYKKALQASKALGQTSLPVFSMDPIEEDDFYCKLAQAQIARKNYDAAIQSLLTVPIQKRNIKGVVTEFVGMVQKGAKSVKISAHDGLTRPIYVITENLS